jgi:virginiamycin A acetyltransferase
MRPRLIVKRAIQGLSLAITFLPAALCWFGRIPVAFDFFAQACAILPGVPGNLLRSAFYKHTLLYCSLDTVISFGTFFTKRDAEVAANVSIGSYCVIGRARIGPRTQIASHVEITSGRRQHVRGREGRFETTLDGHVEIGSDCWIGAAAVVMANVGDRSTIGGGSVVAREIPAGVVAVGVPARPVAGSGAGNGHSGRQV